MKSHSDLNYQMPPRQFWFLPAFQISLSPTTVNLSQVPQCARGLVTASLAYIQFSFLLNKPNIC